MQWVMIKPMKMAPTKPTQRPPFLKAIGIERIPEPMLPLIMWKSAPADLPTVSKLLIKVYKQTMVNRYGNDLYSCCPLPSGAPAIFG